MFWLKIFRVLVFSCLVCFVINPLCAQNIDVLFSGIRSAHGQIIVKIFLDDKSFQADKAIKTVKFKKTGMVNGEMSAKLNLEPGTYGFALLDDENCTDCMNYSFFGLPDEGFGFSNYYLTGLQRPKFDAFKFTLNKNQKLKINMKIRYL